MRGSGALAAFKPTAKSPCNANPPAISPAKQKQACGTTLTPAAKPNPRTPSYATGTRKRAPCENHRRRPRRPATHPDALRLRPGAGRPRRVVIECSAGSPLAGVPASVWVSKRRKRAPYAGNRPSHFCFQNKKTARFGAVFIFRIHKLRGAVCGGRSA